ncbi:MAG: DUF4962 domain-containing protein, partial [Oscillospiraceae bacterium]
MSKKFRIISSVLVSLMLLNAFGAFGSVFAEEKVIEWPTEYNMNGAEMPFYPRADYTCEQNPPDFSWPFVKDAESYDLKVCRDVELTDIAYEKKDIKTNYFNFDKVFECGTYFWSVRYKTKKDVSVWQVARRFRIDKDAYPFPVPSVDEMISNIRKTHPRVLVNSDTLEAFRELASVPAKADFDVKHKFVDRVMNEPMIEEPKNGIAGSGDDAILAQRDIIGVTTKVTTAMEQSALVYLVTQDKKYAEYAVKLLTNLATWDPEGSTSYRIQDQAHRLIAYKSAIVYDWVYDFLTEEQKQSILSMIKVRTKTMIDDIFVNTPLWEMPFESHGWTAIGYIGGILVATFDEMPEAEGWLRTLLPLYINVVPPWSNEDGGWSQGTGYYRYSSEDNAMINDILLSANVLGGNGTYDKAWAKNEKYFPLYMYPKGSIGGFGDQGGQPQGVWMKQVYNILGHITKDPAVKWASDQLGEIAGDIYLNNYYWGAALNQMEGKPPLDLPLSKYFKDIGWVAMHSDLVDPNRVSMFFKSSPYGSYNHSHPDQNSFIIQAYGEPLAIESGYMDAYYSTFEMGYTRQTFAHNAITLDDGKGQPIGKITAKGEIDDFINHCDFNVTSGDAVAAY